MILQLGLEGQYHVSDLWWTYKRAGGGLRVVDNVTHEKNKKTTWPFLSVERLHLRQATVILIGA